MFVYHVVIASSRTCGMKQSNYRTLSKIASLPAGRQTYNDVLF